MVARHKKASKMTDDKIIDLMKTIQARRNDPEYMERLDRIISENKVILDRLKESALADKFLTWDDQN